jgi:hypothetical protein
LTPAEVVEMNVEEQRPGSVFRKLARLCAALVIVQLLGACGDGEPRSLDALVQREGRYLDPKDFRSYSGPVFSTFRDDPDAVEMEARLVDGRLDGPYERFYRDGSVFGRGAYRAGVWHGPFESFYRDGTLWMEGRYEHGALDGPYVAYREDGSVQERGTYAAGNPCGTWIMDGEEETHPACP